MGQFIKIFLEWGEEFVKPFKTFIQNNYSNPILMVALLALGLFLFGYTYSALNKNH